MQPTPKFSFSKEILAQKNKIWREIDVTSFLNIAFSLAKIPNSECE